MLFIQTLMNVYQIYSYLLKMKLNLHKGPNSNYNTFYGYKVIAYTLSKKIWFHLLEKSPSPIRKTNGLATPNKKIKSREHSSILILPCQATKFSGWPHTLSYIISCISLNNYISCIPWLSPIFTCIT